MAAAESATNDGRRTGSLGTSLGLYFHVAAALGLAFFVASTVIWIDEPFDAGISGRVGGIYAYSIRAFDALGPWRMRLAPCGYFHPASPDSVVPYLHHPAPTYLLSWASYEVFGRDERAIRLPFVAATIASLVLLYAAARALGDARRAAIALIFATTLPVVVHFGSMVNVDPFVILSWILIAWLARRLRTRPTRFARIGYFAASLAAGLSDWLGYAIAPWIALDILLDRPGLRAWFARTASRAVPFLLALAIHLAWVAWVLGDSAGVRDNLATLLRICGGGDVPFLRLELERSYPAALALHFRNVVGLPLLAFAVPGLALIAQRLVRRRADDLDRVALMLVGAGFLCITVVWRRAIELDSWLLPLAPGLALAGATTASSLWARLEAAPAWGRASAAFALFLLVAATAVYGARMGNARHIADRSRDHVQVARDLDAFIGAKDTLIVTDSIGPALYYARPNVVHGVRTPEMLEAVKPRLRAAAGGIERVFLGSYVETFSEDLSWAIGMPRRVGASPAIRRVAGRDFAVVELDKAKLFEP